MDRNAVFFGFQFPHHGPFSAFSAMKNSMKPYARVLDASPPSKRFNMPALSRFDFKWRKYSEYRLKPFFLKNDPSVIHYFFPENTLFEGDKWKKHHKLVLTCHQPVESNPFKNLIKSRPEYLKAMQVADVIILMASNDINAYRKLLPSTEVLCIPHGINTSFFKPPEQKLKSKNILTVGSWLRDYDFWCAVVKEALQQDPGLSFSVVAGSDVHNKIRKNFGGRLPAGLRLLIGISDKELCDEYRRSCLVFLPLIDAWANNALLEASSTGTPVMATDLPAVKEYLGNDQAVCFLNTDARAVAEQLCDIVNDNDRLENIGRALRDRMVDQYSWEKIAIAHAVLYNKLLNNG